MDATLGICHSVWMTVWYAGWNEWFIPPCIQEKRNNHTKENCAPSWLYLQDYAGMHGQQNIKYSDKA
jgi:hypothetical protein